MASGGLCFSRNITKGWLHQDDFSYATLLLVLFLTICHEIIPPRPYFQVREPRFQLLVLAAAFCLLLAEDSGPS